MIYIASGYLTRPAKLREKGRFINEMRLSTGFMNKVTSRFVPPLCSRGVWGCAPNTKSQGWRQCWYDLNSDMEMSGFPTTSWEIILGQHRRQHERCQANNKSTVGQCHICLPGYNNTSLISPLVHWRSNLLFKRRTHSTIAHRHYWTWSYRAHIDIKCEKSQ